MTSLAHIADRVLNRPLLIMPDKLAVIAQVLGGRIGIEAGALAPDASRFVGSPIDEDEETGRRTGLPYKRTESGVAVISIVGSLVNRGAWLGASSGLVSYEAIKFQVGKAAADPKVKSIVLDMETPGGEAVGAFEAGAAVRAAAAVKPVTAIINGMAASAGYAIASGASRIISTDTGISGSIGVVMMHADYSRMLDREGITPTFIYAGAHKVDGNPYEPLSKSVSADLQAEIDGFYDLFVENVAAGRKRMSAKAIRGTEARTFVGAKAKEVGLVDDLGTFEEVIEDMSRSARGRSATGRTTRMDGNFTQADLDRARAEGHKAGHEEGHKAGLAEGQKIGMDAGRVEGAKAERDRVKSILGHEEAKGRESTAQHFALNTDLGLEAAVGALTGVPNLSALESRAGSVHTAIVEATGAKPANAPKQAGTVSWDTIAAKVNGKGVATPPPRLTQPGAVPWDDIAAELNAERGAAPKPKQAGAASWDEIAAELNGGLSG